MIKVLTWATVAVLVTSTFALLGRAIAGDYAYTVKKEIIYKPIVSEELSSALVFLPSPAGPVLHHPFSYLLNDPSLAGAVVYALNRQNKNVDLIKTSNRKPYYFVYAPPIGKDSSAMVQTALIPLTLREGNNISFDVVATNVVGKPYVVTYIWNQQRTETYVLDENSKEGKTYNFRWKLSSEGLEFDGDHIGQYGKVVLSSDTPINLVVAFSETPERNVQEIYEERFWFDIAGQKMRIVAPGENWTNVDWPTGPWREQDVAPVLRIAAHAQG